MHVEERSDTMSSAMYNPDQRPIGAVWPGCLVCVLGLVRETQLDIPIIPLSTLEALLLVLGGGPVMQRPHHVCCTVLVLSPVDQVHLLPPP